MERRLREAECRRAICRDGARAVLLIGFIIPPIERAVIPGPGRSENQERMA